MSVFITYWDDGMHHEQSVGYLEVKYDCPAFVLLIDGGDSSCNYQTAVFLKQLWLRSHCFKEIVLKQMMFLTLIFTV